ncbi:hypothetical protein C8R43DRAFT_877644 [Mycena crocata]|nr:hypothetical protein C8R43DRAFT_877644 [Mycena crocata]
MALYILTRRRCNNMPPGPPRDPLIGHLRYIPSKQNSLVFHDWSKKYGDVMYLEVLCQPMIVLDSQRAAIDLLDNRSANYSDRPAYIRYEM